MDKSYFCFLLEWADMFNILTAEQCGQLIKSMIAYEKDDIEPELTDDILRFAWMSNIKPKLDAMKEHYREKVRQASEAGKASAEKRKQKQRMSTSVEIVEQNEHTPTDSTNNNLVNNLVNSLDLKENSLKEKNKKISVDGLEVIKLYEERFGVVSSYRATQLDDLVQDFGKDAVAYAVRQANISSSTSINYIRTTAMNYVRRAEDGRNVKPISTEKHYGKGTVV